MKGREQGCCKGRSRQGAVGQWSGALDFSSFGSFSSSLAFDTVEAMSASSKMAKDVDEVMSESSWTALAKGKERDRNVWAAWRAVFLPSQEGAGGGRRGVQPLRLCWNAQGVCADWSALFRQQIVEPDQVVVSLLF